MSLLLGLLRIGLSLLLLLSLLDWWGDFDLFLAPHGVLPLGAAIGEVSGGKTSWSLYYGSSYPAYPYLLFGLTLLANLALLAGWHSRLAGPCLWLLLLSLQNRAAVTLDATDAALLLGLGVGLLLPWEQRLAVSPPPPVKLSRRLLLLIPVALGAATLLLYPGCRAFWALGPRAPAPDEAPSIAVVQIDSDGRRQDLLSPEPRLQAPNGDSELIGSPRRQRYLAALAEQPHGKLATRLAFSYYRRAWRDGDRTLRRVEVYQLHPGSAESSESLLGCWPPLNAR